MSDLNSKFSNACDLYRRSKEDLVREDLEKQAITPHNNIISMKGMHYA
ncbi:hypothetical protein PRIPAC_81983 [Pristionchus pacificus]|uniref:Uncharacterized protein n=1 Tax=Pristionchus pacificus TaxID=54126 RepID=A0A2A6BY24_PRIPA|nr:hypothetical protein PRIPAC_81983 [Pristionchus pacificus]|eukprot:PDM70756.1 hypothetical protein PRIPAC_44960 [Pristionchus pacificus]